MTPQQIFYAIGTVLLFGLFLLGFSIGTSMKRFRKSGRVALLWFSIFLFYVALVRVLSFFNIITESDSRLINSIGTIIVFLSLAYHLFLYRDIDDTPLPGTDLPKEQELRIEGKITKK